MKRAIPSPKKCIFCGQPSKMTAEHIWPDWLRSHIPRLFTHSNHTTSLTGQNAARGFHQVKKGRLHRPGDPHSQKLRIVCGPCNNGWMSFLQQAAKPILIPFIQGEWPEISGSEQRTLSAWATMFTMVVEFADLDTIATTQQQREFFRLNKNPPDGWYVWLGDYKGTRWRGIFNHFGWGGIKALDDSGKSFAIAEQQAQSTAFCIGSLFFQTCSSQKAFIRVDPSSFAERHGLAQLWPLLKTPLVKPKAILNDYSADAISSSFFPSPPHLIRRAWQTI